MMRLATNPDFAVELSIAGYQFPGEHSADYDSNWLIIEGRVRHPRGDWTFRDPCLLTYEAAKLAVWLESVATDCKTNPQLGFLEPNLSFEVVAAEVGWVLRVEFRLESRPPWTSRDEHVVIDFPVEELELAEAISEWREQLRQYPQRAAC